MMSRIRLIKRLLLKYKSETLKMVKSLELIEAAPIALGIKPELLND
jgi:hypothetical protein